MLFRKARFSDVEPIHHLINDYAEKGLMLSRSRNTLYESLREFVVAEEEGQIIGVAALHLVWDELAEARAVAVTPQYAKTGIGSKLIQALVEEAHELGVKTLFTLTYQPVFFTKQGFREVPKETLSHKVWKECINCVKFPNCDEIAMIRSLD